MKTLCPIGYPGMVFTEGAIEGLREQVGTVLPLKIDDEVVGEAKIVGVSVIDGDPFLEIEMEEAWLEKATLEMEGPLAAMSVLRSMPEEKP